MASVDGLEMDVGRGVLSPQGHPPDDGFYWEYVPAADPILR